MGKRKAKNDSDGQNSGPPNPQPRPMGKEAVIAAAAAEGRPVRVYADGRTTMVYAHGCNNKYVGVSQQR